MSEKETLSLVVINDNSINSGQKILFRTPDYHDLLLMYDDGADVAKDFIRKRDRFPKKTGMR